MSIKAKIRRNSTILIQFWIMRNISCWFNPWFFSIKYNVDSRQILLAMEFQLYEILCHWLPWWLSFNGLFGYTIQSLVVVYIDNIILLHFANLDGGFPTVLCCCSLQLNCMHYGISSNRNAQYVETTLDAHVHLLGRVVVRSDVYMLTFAMIRIIL